MRGRRNKPASPNSKIKRVERCVEPTEAGFGVVMRINPPVEIDGEVFDAGAQPHINDAGNGQPAVGAQRMRGCALGGEPSETGVDLGSQVVAVAVVGDGEG